MGKDCLCVDLPSQYRYKQYLSNQNDFAKAVVTKNYKVGLDKFEVTCF